MKLKCIFTFECYVFYIHYTYDYSKSRVVPILGVPCQWRNTQVWLFVRSGCSHRELWILLLLIHHHPLQWNEKKRSNYYLVEFINLLRKKTKLNIAVCLIIKEFNNFTLKTSNTHFCTHRDECKMLPTAENWHGNYLLLHASIWY